MSRQVAARAQETRSARRDQRRREVIIACVTATLAVVALIWAPNAVTPGATSAPQAGRVRGLADAPISVEEYADFQCPACGQFARTTATQLVATYVATGKVKIVFHHFAFLGMESNWAAEAAECAGEQGRFWELHDRLYASQAGENRGAFAKANLKRMGQELGLGASFAACVDSGRYASTVTDATRSATDRGIRATPTIVIDGQVIEGAVSFEHLRTLIDAALAR
jgi:protein-disulfide isomerase